MKRFISMFIAVLMIAIFHSGYAQVSGYGLSGTLAMPSGSFGNVAGTGFGGMGTIFYEYDDKIELTGSAGFLKFGGKEFSFLTATGFEYQYSVVPILTGGRFYLGEEDAGMRPYLSGEIGYFLYFLTVKEPDGGSSLFTGSTDGAQRFGVIPGVGVKLSSLDIKFAYSLADLNYFGLNVGIAINK